MSECTVRTNGQRRSGGLNFRAGVAADISVDSRWLKRVETTRCSLPELLLELQRSSDWAAASKRTWPDEKTSVMVHCLSFREDGEGVCAGERGR